MSIIRTEKNTNFFLASNESFNDERLSWEARGLMGYLLSKPNHWEIRTRDLEKKGPAGEHKLRRMIAELRQYGYVNRIRCTLPNGQFAWITQIFESPSMNPNPGIKITTRRFSTSGSSTSGSSTSGKPPDILNTEEENTNKDEETERLKKLAKLHEENIGPLTQLLSAELITASQKYTVISWYEEAFKIAVKNNARRWAYVEAVLDGWLRNGYGWKPNGKGKQYVKKTPADQPDLDDGFMEELARKQGRAGNV